MSTLKRDKRKKAQAKHMRRMGMKHTHATKAETIAYVQYRGEMEQKRAMPLVTEKTIKKHQFAGLSMLPFGGAA